MLINESNNYELINCPFCGEEIIYKSFRCKHCDSLIEDSLEHKNICDNNKHLHKMQKNWTMGILIFAGILVLLGLSMMSLKINNFLSTGIMWFEAK